MITREIKYMENELDNMFACLKQIQGCASGINSILEYIEIDGKKKTYNRNKQDIIQKFYAIINRTNSFVDIESDEIGTIKKMIYELILVNKE